MVDLDDYFGGLTKEEYEELEKQHFEDLRNNAILTLIDKYVEKHELAKECGSEYVYQSDRAQIDALKLVGDIFDLYIED